MLQFVLWLLFTASLFASETPDAFCMATTECEPSALVEGCVSAISGDFYDVTEDLVVQGAEPIRIYRSYLSRKGDEWTVVPHAEICPISDGYMVTEPNGTELFYKLKSKEKVGKETIGRYEPSNLNTGFSNTSQGKISSFTNRRNNFFTLEQEKQKFLTMYCADGTIRSYKRQHHSHNFQLLSERLPNGNYVLYEYMEDAHFNEFLAKIRTTNPAQTKIYAQVEFSPPVPIHKSTPSKVKERRLITSDGRELVYKYTDQSPWRYLEQVVSPEKPDTHYSYTMPHIPSHFGQFLTLITHPLNRQLQVGYYFKTTEIVNGNTIYLPNETVQDEHSYEHLLVDPRRGRVKTLSSPIGTDATLHTTHWFIYDLEHRKTSVYDIEQARTDYFWNEELRLERIERFGKDGALKTVEKFVWDGSNLAVKALLDGQRKPISARRYFYDGKGNIVEDQLYGNLSGQGAALVLDAKGYPVANGVELFSTRFQYRYENHISYLLREETDAGLVIVHEYLPGTQLPVSELTYDKSTLKRTHCFEYNEDHILVADITDERIVRITPMSSGPYAGMPEVIAEHDSQNHLLKKTVLTYTTGGNIAQKDIYDANNVFRYSLKFSYDDKGRLISQTNALGQEETFSYDACNNLIQYKPVSGRARISTTYDCSNRPVLEQTDGDDGIVLQTRHSYDLKSRKIAEEKPFGNTTFYRYNSAGFLSEKQTGPYIFRYTRDALGNVVTATNPDGSVTKTAYNVRSQPIRAEHPDSGIEHWTYALDGTQASYTDPAGIKTAYTHDFICRMTSKTIGSDYQEQWIYDGQHLLQHTDAEGHATTYEYDPAGRLHAEKRADQAVFFSYDPLGRKCQEQTEHLLHRTEHDLLDRSIEETELDTEGHLFIKALYHYNSAGLIDSTTRNICGQTAIEHTTYDSLGRPTTTTDARSFSTTTRYEHLSDGRRITTTDPTGLQTIQRYDSLDRLITSDIPGFLHEEFTHDFRGNVLSHTSQTPERTCRLEKAYDSMGRLTRLQEPLGKTTAHSYNTSGLLTQTIKPDGTRLTYTYTPLRHLQSLTSSDHTIHYTYYHDRLGRLLQSTDETTQRSTLRTYDPHSNLLSETLANGLTLHSTYDPQNRRTSLTLPNQSTITYTHDARFLRTIAYKHLTHHFTTYDLSGRLTHELTPLGPIDKQYNPTGALDSISSSHLSHSVLKRDPVGNILQTNVASYTYDPLHQLASETNHTYTHDAHHCRLSKDQERYQPNQLLQLPDQMLYDPNGNPIQCKNNTILYDALDRPVEITTPAHILRFTYDSDHRRLSKTTTDRATGIDKTDLYLYDGPHEIGMANNDRALTQLRILGPTAHAEIGAAIALELHGKTYIPLHDLFGNVRHLVDADHNTIATTHYYGTFGEEPAPPTETSWLSWPTLFTPELPLHNPWRYASKRIDDELGWIWFGRRFYQPDLGRWLTPDPIGHTAGVNLYAFVRNNPLVRVDEFGLIDFGQYDRHEGEWQRPEREHNISSALVHATADLALDIAHIATTDPLSSFFGSFGSNSAPLHEQLLGSLRSWIHRQTAPHRRNRCSLPKHLLG